MRSLVVAVGLAACGLAAGAPIMTAPSGERYVERNAAGETVLPNGRLIAPEGAMHRVRPHPYGLTMSGDGRWVVAVSSDGPQLSILDFKDPAAPVVSYIPDDAGAGKGVLDSAFMGLAFAPDHKTLYVAGSKSWVVYAFDVETRAKLFDIPLKHKADGEHFNFGYAGDLRLSPDGNTLYVCDQSNFRVVVVGVPERAVLQSVRVGRYPFGIALSPDGARAYVANVGIYEYAYHRNAKGRIAPLPFPPFAAPSKEAVEGTVIDGVTVPALGDPNDVAGMSVWTLDVSQRGAARVVAKTKTGHLVGEQLEDFPAVGGSSPNSIAATAAHVFVSNGSNDSISVIDAATGERLPDIDLVLHEHARTLRGMIPFGVALAPDGGTLYVCEAGVNAVAAIRTSDRTVIGRTPTAWFPSKLAVSPDGARLYIACAKGLGSGPNAGPGHTPGDPTGIGSLMRGYIQVADVPRDAAAWAAGAQRVAGLTVRLHAEDPHGRAAGHPVPPRPGAWASPIKHVVYVTKENRTYDEVFGAIEGGRGDAAMARLGTPIDVSSEDGTRTVKRVVLMPNHVALAKRFAINDNFYCDSDHSVDGHRWLVGTYPNEFMETRIGESAGGDGPGNFSFIGSSGAVYPEDYNEAGSIWEHFARGNLRFYNFGLGFEFKPQDERIEYSDTGIRLPINYPLPKPLFENTARDYATYNTNIPDQFRMDVFEKHFRERWLSGAEPMPAVITMMLPNDHGADERPADGYPFWGSYMSDNDLALGRLVELISHSPFWKETVIFVTEDDAQGYRDTVDAHRSVCMAIGPHVKRGHVSHTHSSFGSILKTMFLIHGLPPLNQYDGFSSDLGGMFEAEPVNAEPYDALPVHPEVFDPQKAFDPFDKEFNWKAVNEFVPLDDQAFLDSDDYGHSGEAGHGPRAADAE